MAIKAFLLGIIEGLTEFLPVSSTGHLIIANTFIPLERDFEAVFNIVIQIGAILAVLVCYRKQLMPEGMLSFFRPGFFRNQNISREKREKGRKFFALWSRIALAFLPAAVAGVFLNDFLEKYLFNTESVSAALVAGAFLMLAAERKGDVGAASSGAGAGASGTSDTSDTFGVSESSDAVCEVSARQAIVIGCFQCLAMWPGMSRSASSIAGGLFAGLPRAAAAEFSFFLGIPTIMGASLYRLLKTGFAITADQWLSIAVGTVVSYFVAMAVIKFFINYLKKRGLLPFVFYRIVLGFVIFVFFHF